MQIDIGFGDAIVPKPVDVEYPAMLEFPPAVLRAYPKETVVAEKLEALTVLGMLNSRVKDYYDLALLARPYSFRGDLLVEAIQSTFRYRGTALEIEPGGAYGGFYVRPGTGSTMARVCSSQPTRFGLAIGQDRGAGASLRRVASRRHRREPSFCSRVEARWTVDI